MFSLSDRANTQYLIDKLENLEVDDKIEVNCIHKNLTVTSINSILCLEAYLEASDETEYVLRETRLDEDVLEIEPRTMNSEPVIVRELEVVDQ